ncbi:MAG: hypothetical protein JW934_10155 [Anaerolineae bacterium]|nr:hypothetical protein [Anaerolineae bacterium]
MAHHIIRTIRMAHCKRGPERCEKCREMNVERICLLDVDPPRQGELQRRAIEVEIDGERTWREFDVVRVFETVGEARDYATVHHIGDVELGT